MQRQRQRARQPVPAEIILRRSSTCRLDVLHEIVIELPAVIAAGGFASASSFALKSIEQRNPVPDLVGRDNVRNRLLADPEGVVCKLG